ncbi:MAG: DNA mismatch repair endonuclease MutL [Clostridia bacterium]|nr:DNA mismatch repair endonuclease MutL [Clostridia bacterium]
MAVINLLDKKVYNRISAGEVVERPSSVVKELVENAIDAGATEIFVSIERGGLSAISVKDNGSGIQADQLEKAFLPHATSKIIKAEDLDNILTLGFRGEALASIGAVSKAVIASKTADASMGYAINCEGGELSKIYEYPTLNGTTVSVNELFFNTPAREKFLKSVKSEEGEVLAILTKVALSRPELSFTLIADGKTLLETFGGGLKECISCVYGNKTVENCFTIEGVKNGIKVSGFVGKLNFTKPNRNYQTLIVNGRYVVDSTVSSAVSNAYGGYLMKRQYPFYVINLEIPGEAVDVNVHPRKAEVRFSNNQIVYSAVYSTISKVLDGTSGALEIIKEEGGVSVKDSQKSFGLAVNESGGFRDSALPNLDKKKEQKPNYIDVFADDNKDSSSMGFDFSGNDKSTYGDFAKNTITVRDSGYFGEMQRDQEDGVDVFAENKKYIEKLEREKLLKDLVLKQEEIEVEPNMQYIGQVFSTYLIFERGSDIYLIDQHAAHERLLYDELCEKAGKGRLESQPLLIPYVFNASGDEFDLIYSRLEYFRELGLDICNVGDYSFKVFAVPCSLSDMNLREFFYDILYDNEFKRESIPLAVREKLMQKACKHAIKAGDKLTNADIDALMAKLNGNLGLRCPHGRPIAVKITKVEIEKWFKRIV